VTGDVEVDIWRLVGAGAEAQPGSNSVIEEKLENPVHSWNLN
jgi:hypothetical protein